VGAGDQPGAVGQGGGQAQDARADRSVADPDGLSGGEGAPAKAVVGIELQVGQGLGGVQRVAGQDQGQVAAVMGVAGQRCGGEQLAGFGEPGGRRARGRGEVAVEQAGSQHVVTEAVVVGLDQGQGQHLGGGVASAFTQGKRAGPLLGPVGRAAEFVDDLPQVGRRQRRGRRAAVTGEQRREAHHAVEQDAGGRGVGRHAGEGLAQVGTGVGAGGGGEGQGGQGGEDADRARTHGSLRSWWGRASEWAVPGAQSRLKCAG